MNFSKFLRASMKFVTPEQYSRTNQAHFFINTSAVNDFIKVNSPLTVNSKVLDFGCGTGETTLAISQGLLGNLGKPGQVMGVDISKDMISYCKSKHSSSNLQFERMDVEDKDCQAFCSSGAGSFHLITSFSCLHWVHNLPLALSVFNRLLTIGGKFLFVFVSTHNRRENVQLKVYEKMRGEPEWESLLRNTRWPHLGTVYTNSSWMSTGRIPGDGTGHIQEQDFSNLVTSLGFKVESSKAVPLKYVLNKDFTKGFFKDGILTAFPELQGEDRKQFFTEYINRLKSDASHKTLEQDGYIESIFDGVQIFGEKVANC